MPLTFTEFMVLAADGSSPAQQAPTVSCVSPGGAWFTPMTAPISLGDGWWSVTIQDSELTGGYPLLAYLVSSDSFPTIDALGGPSSNLWTAGGVNPPFPFWLGTTASNDWLPAAGLSPSVQVDPPGGTWGAGAGTVSEPGGAGNGNGFYWYYPAASETAQAGLFLLLASVATAVDAAAQFTVAAPSVVGGQATQPSNATLNLNQAPRTSVFRQIVAFIRNDATMKRIFKPTSIRAWDGLPQDTAAFDISVAPAIRLTPVTGPDVFWSPGSMKGDIFINVEMVVMGTCVDDVSNLWYAMTRAIYPAAQSSLNANVQALQKAGSYDGLVTFTSPAFEAAPSDNYFAAAGQIRVSVTNQLLAG